MTDQEKTQEHKEPGSALAAPQIGQLTSISDNFSSADLHNWHRDVNTNPGAISRLAFMVLILVVGFGGIWGCTAPIGGAVIGSGRVIAEGRNRVIQHLEGGILNDLYVREGDHVKAGDVVAKLDDTQLRTQLDSAHLQAAILRAQLARRRAEVNDRSRIVFPVDFPQHISQHPRLLETIDSQRSEFDALRALRDTEIVSIEKRIKGANRQAEGAQELLTTQTRQADLLRRELSDLDQLVEKDLIRRAEVFARRRALADIEGRIATSRLQIATAEGEAENLENEILQTRQGYLRDANAVLVEIQQQLNQVEQTVERLVDILDRGEIRTPVDGTIFRISKRTLGAVLQPAESLMEIFPDGDALTVEAMIMPKDIEAVSLGQEARVVFPSSRKKGLSPIDGEVTYLSADAIVSDNQPAGYYIAHIRISDADLELLPGNSAEVYFRTEPKTFFGYMAEPISRFAFRIFKG